MTCDEDVLALSLHAAKTEESARGTRGVSRVKSNDVLEVPQNAVGWPEAPARPQIEASTE